MPTLVILLLFAACQHPPRPDDYGRPCTDWCPDGMECAYHEPHSSTDRVEIGYF